MFKPSHFSHHFINFFEDILIYSSSKQPAILVSVQIMQALLQYVPSDVSEHTNVLSSNYHTTAHSPVESDPSTHLCGPVSLWYDQYRSRREPADCPLQSETTLQAAGLGVLSWIHPSHGADTTNTTEGSSKYSGMYVRSNDLTRTRNKLFLCINLSFGIWERLVVIIWRSECAQGKLELLTRTYDKWNLPLSSLLSVWHIFFVIC